MKNTLIFSIALLFVFSSCKKENTPTNNNTITINSAPQFSATIAGNQFSYKSGVGGISSGSIADKNENPPDPTTAKYISNLYRDSSGTSVFSIRKGTLSFTGSTPSDSAFKSFLAKTTYPVSLNAINGVEITWYDANGNDWSTSNAPGTQTSSSFNITEVLESNPGTYTIKVKATFTCTLYSNSGQSRVLTAGVYVGYFENN